MKKSGLIAIYSLLSAFVLGVIATVIILASSTQNIGSKVSVVYVATEISGSVSATYKVGSSDAKNMTDSNGNTVVSFASDQPTTLSLLAPKETIYLSSTDDITFTYTFTNIGEQYYASVSYEDTDATSPSKNLSIMYQNSTASSGYSEETEVVTVPREGSVTYSIKISIKSIYLNASLNGTISWALTKNHPFKVTSEDTNTTLFLANNDGSKVTSSNISIEVDSSNNKFKIVGAVPSASTTTTSGYVNGGLRSPIASSNNGLMSVTNLTNTNGAEFYYFCTNPAVVGSSSYVDPGTIYWTSTADKTLETWYDLPTSDITLYACFMTPTYTGGTWSGNGYSQVIISNSVTSIPDKTFQNQKDLVVIPQSVESIGSEAFSGAGYGPWYISHSVKSVGFSAFSWINTMSSLDLSGATSLGSRVIHRANVYFKSLYLSNKLENLESGSLWTGVSSSYATSYTIYYDGTLAEFEAVLDKCGKNTYGIYLPFCFAGDLWGDSGYKITVIANDNTGYYATSLDCFSLDTEITCYDEKRKKWYKKKLRDITYKDKIVVWNFDEGKFDVASPIFIAKTKVATRYTLVRLADGTELKLIGANDSKRHRMFVKETNHFDYVNKSLIGKTTFNEKGEFVKIEDIQFVDGKIEYSNIETAYHFNCFTNGILTSGDRSNIYKIQDMKYVKEYREPRPLSEFKGVDKKYYDALRLAEQPRYKVDKDGNVEYVDWVEYVAKWQAMSKD